jgi:CDP-glucose 4,6-dehydratase
VFEPLSGYLLLGANLLQSNNYHGEAYNFGPFVHQSYTVSELIDQMAKSWNQVRWSDVSQDQNYLHEAGLLKLNCDKALFDLNWQPTLQFEETVRMTVEWYKSFYEGQNKSMSDFTMAQIEEYVQFAKSRNMIWAL